jgi:hypothetical protein
MLTAAPVEVLPRPELASEFEARLRATSSAMAALVEVVDAADVSTTVPATACVDCVPETAPPEAHIEVLQGIRVLPELGRHFHDDMILLRTEGVEDVRDLSLRKRVAQRIVDLNLREPKPRRAVAVHDEIGFQAAGLQIGIHVGDFRHALKRGAQLLRPGLQLGQVIAEQGPLILGVGRSSSAANVLHGLQISRNARDSVQLRPQSRDDAIRGDAPFGQGLERDGDVGARGAAGRAEAAAAHGSGDGFHRRVRLNDGRDFLQLALHQLERGGRVAANSALQLTGILLREETLRNHHVKVDIEADGREQQQQHGSRVVQRPIERAFISAAQPREAAFECLHESRRFALMHASEEQRAHHRRRGQ